MARLVHVFHSPSGLKTISQANILQGKVDGEFSVMKLKNEHNNKLIILMNMVI